MPDGRLVRTAARVYRMLAPRIVAGAIFGASACQTAPPAATSEGLNHPSEAAPPSSAASTIPPLFAGAALHSPRFHCTITQLSVAHEQWDLQHTERWMTFEKVLGTADLHRWQATQPDGSAIVIDSRVDGSSVYWFHDAALLLPSALTGSCGTNPVDTSQRPTVCANPIAVGAAWETPLPAPAQSDAELSDALQSFQTVPDEAQPDTERCQLLAARWNNATLLSSTTEVRTRWCLNSGPVYLQTRHWMAGIAQWSIQRCELDREEQTDQPPP
jgi:hypothetical protein